jgi:hypothetical protein
MPLLFMFEQIKSFARAYIAGEVTPERRNLISKAYFKLTGEKLRTHCSTCYIEAIFIILRKMEKQPCRYRLKKGAVLQAFGDESKIATNDNLTDELAQWHLAHTRGAASLFAIMPEAPPEDQELEIVPAEKTEPVKRTRKPRNK